MMLAVTACTLFGRSSDAGDPSTVVVTATPAAGTAIAPNAQPTETATPTPTLDPAFPTPVLAETWIAEQEFERGWAFSLQDRSEIWVAAFTDSRGGTWTIYEDEFYNEFERTGEELVIEFDQTPPEGRVMPVRGFGWLWVNNPEVREALGWAVWIELGQQTTLRYDAGGLINAQEAYVPRPGRFTLTNLGSDVFVFDEDLATFTWVPSS
jgi:hypothetical protein